MFNKTSVIIFLGTFLGVMGIIGFVGRIGVIGVIRAQDTVSEPSTGLTYVSFAKLNEPTFTGLLKPVFLAPTSIQFAKLNLDKPLEEVGRQWPDWRPQQLARGGLLHREQYAGRGWQHHRRWSLRR